MLFLGVFIGTLADRYALERTSFTGRVVLSADQVQAQQDTFERLQNDVRELQTRADTASSELMVERAARQELEKQLKDSQAETGRANERLAFFEQLLPPGPDGVLEIRGMQVDHDGSALKYKVLLMRSGHSAGAPFTGALSFKGQGMLLGEPVTVDLVPMQAKPESELNSESGKLAPLNFKFEQYFRREGVLGMPEDFEVEHVTVNVQVGDTVIASRTVEIER